VRRQALIVLFLAVGVAGATAAPPKKKPPNRPPKVTPIAATFVQQDFATYYHATATDPDGDKLVSTWSLKPPKADPGCSLFNSPDPSDAVWKHGDQNGCNHQIYYNRGHPGIITLKVTDGTFTCTETYFGTLTGKGLFADCKRNKVPKPAGGGKGGKNGGGNNGGGNNGGGNNGGNGGGNGGGGGGGGSGGGGGAQATSKVKLSAKPDTGKPPLAVTFTIKAPKATGWRIDFGDGKSTGAQGTPPKTLAHTYAKEGDFKPILRVQTDPATAYSGATSVLVHLKQLVGLSVSPPSGKSPLKVTFSLETSVTKPAEWDLDFGDGTPPMRGSGDPPATVTHTYAKDGSYKASLAIKPGSLSLLATFATVTVGGGTPPVLSIKAKPTSGKVPLTVTFTTVENVPPRVVSWKIVFGDSTQFASGQGAPPATVTHTFTKKGTFRVYLFVAQQQQYGGVQYQTYVDVTPG
jgi:PKD repeat protein